MPLGPTYQTLFVEQFLTYIGLLLGLSIKLGWDEQGASQNPSSKPAL